MAQPPFSFRSRSTAQYRPSYENAASQMTSVPRAISSSVFRIIRGRSSFPSSMYAVTFTEGPNSPRARSPTSSPVRNRFILPSSCGTASGWYLLIHAPFGQDHTRT